MSILLEQHIAKSPASEFARLLNYQESEQRCNGDLYATDHLASEKTRIINELLESIREDSQVIPELLQWLLESYAGTVPLDTFLHLFPSTPGQLRELADAASKGVIPAGELAIQRDPDTKPVETQLYASIISVLSMGETIPLTVIRQLILLSKNLPDIQTVFGYMVNKRRTAVLDHFIKIEQEQASIRRIMDPKTVSIKDEWEQVRDIATTSTEEQVRGELTVVVKNAAKSAENVMKREFQLLSDIGRVEPVRAKLEPDKREK